MYPNNQQKETVSIHLPITDDQAGGDNGGNGSVDALHVAPLPGCTADFRLGSVGSLWSRNWAVIWFSGSLCAACHSW